MGLAKELQTNAVAAVKQQLLDGLQADIDALVEGRTDEYNRLTRERDAAYSAATRAVASKTEALRVVTLALKSYDATQPAPLEAKNLYFLDSRTAPKGDGRGHWMSVDKFGGKVTCSCKGFQFEGKCWASTYLAKIQKSGDHSWPYFGTVEEFIARKNKGWSSQRTGPSNAASLRA